MAGKFGSNDIEMSSKCLEEVQLAAENLVAYDELQISVLKERRMSGYSSLKARELASGLFLT